jgi:hypothetical protein
MKALDWLERGWCRAMHPDPMWPIHGHYVCPACGRVYPVPWQEGDQFVGSTAVNKGDKKSRAAHFELQKT